MGSRKASSCPTGRTSDRGCMKFLGSVLLRLSFESPDGSSDHRQFGGRGRVRRWAGEIWAIPGLSEAEIQAAADRNPGLTAKYSPPNRGWEIDLHSRYEICHRYGFVETAAALLGGSGSVHAIGLGIKPFAELGTNSSSLSGSAGDSSCSRRTILGLAFQMQANHFSTVTGRDPRRALPGHRGLSLMRGEL